MHLAFLDYGGLGRGIEHCDFRENLNALVVLLALFQNFRFSQQCLEMLGVASLVFIQDLLEVSQCLLLEILLLGGEVDPAFDSQGCEASLVLL